MVVCIWNYPLKSLELRLATDTDSRKGCVEGNCEDPLLLIGYRGKNQIVVVSAVSTTENVYYCQ